MFYQLILLLFLWVSYWSFTDNNVMDLFNVLICTLHFGYILSIVVLCLASTVALLSVGCLLCLLNTIMLLYCLTDWPCYWQLSLCSVWLIYLYIDECLRWTSWKILHQCWFHLVCSEDLNWNLQVHLPASALWH